MQPPKIEILTHDETRMILNGNALGETSQM